MIEGRVTRERKAVVSLTVQGPRGQRVATETVIDTGFTGYIALPAQQVSELGLRFLGARDGVLADGRPAVLNAFQAVVQWHGQPRSVPALEVQGSALLGMALIEGSRLTLDATPDGPVHIQPLA
ncbi:MAG: hypothetical protein FJ290_25385 [Planctomycetes bacterium]|nr:hypothetical protein [Planctomycetota bacterium]